jgi:ABC-type Fe3+ transport system permease subunit
MPRIATTQKATLPQVSENGLRQTIDRLRRSPRVAAALWLVLAFAVWNVIFDRILVLAGRRYGAAADTAAQHGHDYVRIDDWMRPAIVHGVRVASVVALAIALFGLMAVAIASRVDRKRTDAPS